MYNCKDFCIDSKKTVRDALEMINSKPQKIVFAVDDDYRLEASLTDGDVRRFFLKGGSIDAPLMEAANISPKYARNLDEAQDLFSSGIYVAIPILNEADVVQDVFFGTKIATDEKVKIDLPVVINAGGKGTRLDPFTRVLPKPLIPIGEKPIIEHIMNQYEDAGSCHFHVIVNYKKQLIKAYFSESEKKYKIEWYDEEKPLGTGGGLSLLKGVLDSTFFFSNCDILIRADYQQMVDFHKKNNDVVTMVCVKKKFTVPYGVVKTDENGLISEMLEKPQMSFLTNTGMYIVEPCVLEDIEDDVPISFPDIIEKQLQKGRKVSAYSIDESEWMDMGQLSELDKMRKRLVEE